MSGLYIVKSTGEKELFSESKLRRSIRRAKIPPFLRSRVINHIKNILYPGITTEEIYRHIILFINQSAYPYQSSRYSLKNAIMDLGPSGFPFEKFIGEILKRNSYSVETDRIIQGNCVQHEIDVVAVKNDEHNLIECKFHNHTGIRNDVKVVLYVQARFEDVMQQLLNEGDLHPVHKAWLVTNTKCTTDAIKYAKCRGMKIVSWGYPEKGNLQQLIESERLYPITCLTSLGRKQNKELLKNNIVLVKQLYENKAILSELQIGKIDRDRIIREAGILLDS